MGVGVRLKEILRDRKMTIKQLAELSGIPLNTLYSITKRDSERVDVVTLNRIAKTLQISIDDLRAPEMSMADLQKIMMVDHGIEIPDNQQMKERLAGVNALIDALKDINPETMKIALALWELARENSKVSRPQPPQAPPAPTSDTDTPEAQDAAEGGSEPGKKG